MSLIDFCLPRHGAKMSVLLPTAFAAAMTYSGLNKLQNDNSISGGVDFSIAALAAGFANRSRRVFLLQERNAQLEAAMAVNDLFGRGGMSGHFGRHVFGDVEIVIVGGESVGTQSHHEGDPYIIEGVTRVVDEPQPRR